MFFKESIFLLISKYEKVFYVGKDEVSVFSFIVMLITLFHPLNFGPSVKEISRYEKKSVVMKFSSGSILKRGNRLF